MPQIPTRAVTTDEQKKDDREQKLDDLIRPGFAESNRYMTGDGTVEHPITSVNTTNTDVTTTQTDQTITFDSDYSAATTPGQKAQVAAKHGKWELAFGNAQNEKGELRGQVEELSRKYQDVLESQAQAPPAAAPAPAQDGYAAIQNFQVVQPNDQFDADAEKLNTAFRNYTMQIAPAFQQIATVAKQLEAKIDGLSKMPQNYTVDPAIEAQLTSELGLAGLPEWHRKNIIQRVAGQQASTPQARAQTGPERNVQRAVNYVEPSNPTAHAPSAEDNTQRMWREYQDARAKEPNPQRKTEAGRQVLLRFGVGRDTDWRQ